VTAAVRGSQRTVSPVLSQVNHAPLTRRLSQFLSLLSIKLVLISQDNSCCTSIVFYRIVLLRYFLDKEVFRGT
jgi:hypothetical protein